MEKERSHNNHFQFDQQQFKDDYFVQFATAIIPQKKVLTLNNDGVSGYGLLAKFATRRIQQRTQQIKCSCNIVTNKNDFGSYTSIKKLDPTLVDNLITHLDKTRKLFKKRFYDLFKTNRDCYCNKICLEELLLDKEYVDKC